MQKFKRILLSKGIELMIKIMYIIVKVKESQS